MKKYPTLSELYHPDRATKDTWDQSFSKDRFLSFLSTQLSEVCGQGLSWDDLLESASHSDDPIFVRIESSCYDGGLIALCMELRLKVSIIAQTRTY